MNCIKDDNGASYIAVHYTQPIFADISSAQQHRSVHTVIAPISSPQYRILLLTTRCLITKTCAVMILPLHNPYTRQVH